MSIGRLFSKCALALALVLTPPAGGFFSSSSPRTITSTKQAAALLSDAKPYILIGNDHTTYADQQIFVGLFPLLAAAKVKVIGLEEGKGRNELYAAIQRQVRAGATEKDAVSMVLDDIKQRDAKYLSGNDRYAAAVGAILFAATKHEMKVVGIDARRDNPEVARLRDKITAEEIEAISNNIEITDDTYNKGDDALYFGFDTQSAAEAKQNLAREPAGSRMAIFYGNDHIIDFPLPYSESPLALGDALGAYGGATRIVSRGYSYDGTSRTSLLTETSARRPAGAIGSYFILGDGLLEDLARLSTAKPPVFSEPGKPDEPSMANKKGCGPGYQPQP